MIETILNLLRIKRKEPEVPETEENRVMKILDEFDTSGFRMVHNSEYATIKVSSHYPNIASHAKNLSILAAKMSDGLPITSLELGSELQTYNLSDYFIDDGIYIDETRSMNNFIKACKRFFQVSFSYCDNLSNDRKSRLSVETIARETIDLVITLNEI